MSKRVCTCHCDAGDTVSRFCIDRLDLSITADIVDAFCSGRDMSRNVPAWGTLSGLNRMMYRKINGCDALDCMKWKLHDGALLAPPHVFAGLKPIGRIVRVPVPHLLEFRDRISVIRHAACYLIKMYSQSRVCGVRPFVPAASAVISDEFRKFMRVNQGGCIQLDDYLGVWSSIDALDTLPIGVTAVTVELDVVKPYASPAKVVDTNARLPDTVDSLTLRGGWYGASRWLQMTHGIGIKHIDTSEIDTGALGARDIGLALSANYSTIETVSISTDGADATKLFDPSVTMPKLKSLTFALDDDTDGDLDSLIQKAIAVSPSLYSFDLQGRAPTRSGICTLIRSVPKGHIMASGLTMRWESMGADSTDLVCSQVMKLDEFRLRGTNCYFSWFAGYLPH